MGHIGILNVGAGDTKLIFDKTKPEDTARACRIVTDMLHKGYALLVEVSRDATGEPLYQRVKAFDETTAEYIIMSDTTETINVTDPATATANEPPTGQTPTKAPQKQKRGQKSKLVATRIHAAETTAIVISRTAGG